MSVIIGSLMGFLSSGLPAILKHIQQSRDQKHELEILKLQQAFIQDGLSMHLEEIRTQAESAEQIALIENQKSIGVKWVDALNAIVRPMITYLFFALYIFIKVAEYKSLTIMGEGNEWEKILQIWNKNDQILFSSIVAFWFGHRSWLKDKNVR